MSLQVQCPDCQVRLNVADDLTEPWISCPRCLARLPNPRESARTPPPLPADFARPDRQFNCPACGKTVRSIMLFCPHCEEPLREHLNEPLDSAARKDGQRTSVALIILAVLGALPIFQLLLATLGGAVQGEVEGFVGGGTVLLVLFAVGALITYIRANQRGQSVRPGRLILNTMAFAGAFVVGCFAMVLFAFLICMTVVVGGGMLGR
jgi:ribosomal protein S27E